MSGTVPFSLPTCLEWHGHGEVYHFLYACTRRLCLKCDGTPAETRFRLSAKRLSPFKSAGHHFSRLLAAEVYAPAAVMVVMLDTPCSEVVWRELATHSICQFPLHFSSCASPCAITFQLDSTTASLLACTHHGPFEQKAYLLLFTISLMTVSTECKLTATIHMPSFSSSSSSSSVGPVANATDVLQPRRLIVLNLSPSAPLWTFPHSPPGASTSATMREILVAKGGTVWARIGL